MKSLLTVVGCASILTLGGVSADDLTHRYKKDEPVEFYVHKVGPLANPQEAYPYYDLPYCAPKSPNAVPQHKDIDSGVHKFFNIGKSISLAEQIGGHVLHHSGHSIKFAGDIYREGCTTQPLTLTDHDKFTEAVREDWFYQMYIDDLPIWGMVGEMENMDGGVLTPGVEGKAMVYTHRKVVIAYNKDRIIHVDLIPDRESLKDIVPGKELTFSTEFEWKETKTEFEDRFHRYLDNKFFKHQIHWFSIFNSFMMVLFLTGLVSLILVRTLRRDYARYSITAGDGGELYDDEIGGTPVVDENGKPILDEEGNPRMKAGGGGAGSMPSEESGWKQVHGDVFRAPYMLTLVAALLGSGWQLIILFLGVILFAVAGPIHGEVHEDRGEMEQAILTCYCLSSVVAGYTSGKYYKMYTSTRRGSKTSDKGGDSSWQVAMMLTTILLPTICGLSVIFLNAIALSYGTINYIPFFALVKLFLLFIFINAPLCIAGTLVGRHGKTDSGRMGGDFPCRVNAIPRPIPESVPWFGKPTNLIPFAGLLSFGSIFIELYYVLTSLWNYKIYHVYGFLLGVSAIMFIVVSMTTIIVVYFCLNAENYLWQWIALGSGGSLAGYVFLYGVYFFMFKTDMHGLLQTTYYFTYMSLISSILGLVCGSVAHAAASKFVRTIFQNVKVD